MISLLASLWLAVIHVILVGLDVIAFFLVIRVLVTRWPVAMFLAFNRVGAPLVDPMMATMAKAIPGIGSRPSLRARMIEALVLLASVEAFRFAVTGVAFFAVRNGGGEVVGAWRI